MSGGEEPADPLADLWALMQHALAPFGIQVTRAHLALWRDQAERRQGPFWAAERGHAEAVQELIDLLRELIGAGETGEDPPQSDPPR